VLRRFRRASHNDEKGPRWSRFINPDLAARTDVAARYSAHRALMISYKSEREQHLNEISAPMQAHALEVLDKAAAGAGVEARYPFWDKRLVEFCLALPADAKLRDGWSRMVLRRAMDGVLPEAVTWRRDKFDFTVHLIRGMLAHHRPMLDQILFEDAVNIGGYVDLAAVTAAYRRMVKHAEAANGYDVQAVWRTAVLALWLRERHAARSDAPMVG
jgi:asparagine synthase (glutamine-hydrolysing)